MYTKWAADEIRIEKLEVFAYHGVYPEETRNGQIFYVNAVLYTDVHRAAAADDLESTVNYGEVCRFIGDWMPANTCKLLEAAAERLAEALLLKYPLLQGADLEIQKPHAPIPMPFGSVSVKVRRAWHRVYLGVGSNMGDRERYLYGAVKSLEAHPLVTVRNVSKWINTSPYGGVEQEDFLNGVIEIETILGPEGLLETLHEIENKAGRVRTLRWGPRTLDLDILLYDELQWAEDNLVIPHPDMANRAFVLQPLAEIAPGLVHPVLGKTAAALLRELERDKCLEKSGE